MSSEAVERHYACPDLEERIYDGLRSLGKNPDILRSEDLAAIDEFHVRGRQATIQLARHLSPERGMQVLDAGCGIGGAARYLAGEFGCRVIGLDLNQEYCRTAAGLTSRLGLDNLVSFQHGNALSLPFPDSSFDIVWTQHAAMNIQDKPGLYREFNRVLKPGGRLALYDVLAGPGGEVHFPVPWAREPSTSFLLTPQQLQETLAGNGFETLVWRDVTEACRDWFRQTQEKIRKNGPPTFSLQLLLGPDFMLMAHNQLRNLEEDRVALVEAVVRRPVSS